MIIEIITLTLMLTDQKFQNVVFSNIHVNIFQMKNVKLEIGFKLIYYSNWCTRTKSFKMSFSQKFINLFQMKKTGLFGRTNWRQHAPTGANWRQLTPTDANRLKDANKRTKWRQQWNMGFNHFRLLLEV